MTRLSWNEIRPRAATFAKEWRDAAYEKSETQSFYNDFFTIFGVKRCSVARYEEHVKKLDNRSGFIDLFWPGVLLVEQKSAGRDLTKAYRQAGDYFDALAEYERPRYILVSDFQTFELHDLDEREHTFFTLADLPHNIEKLGFILGIQKRTFKDQDPVNIQASELMGHLYDALEQSGYTGHDLELFLVRTIFCLFADDTGIFEPRDIFLDFLETRTREDGADLGPWLAQLFEILDTPEADRTTTLDEDLARFPYVNGDLFHDSLRIPSFTAPMRQALLDACQFDWTAISPAIFGALFQSVMDPEQRRSQGAHYTTEKNILKVIEPLFLDDLWAEFAHLKARKDTHRQQELGRFHQRLRTLRFLDPACGCGNFLIIAYRELRALELEVLKELRAYRGDKDTRELYVADLSIVDVDQFCGIEIGEFPVRIAEIALWMMDHIMNNRLSLEFGQTFVRIPMTRLFNEQPYLLQAAAIEEGRVAASVSLSLAEFIPKMIRAVYLKEYARIEDQQMPPLWLIECAKGVICDLQTSPINRKGGADPVALKFIHDSKMLVNQCFFIGYYAMSLRRPIVSINVDDGQEYDIKKIRFVFGELITEAHSGNTDLSGSDVEIWNLGLRWIAILSNALGRKNVVPDSKNMESVLLKAMFSGVTMARAVERIALGK